MAKWKVIVAPRAEKPITGHDLDSFRRELGKTYETHMTFAMASTPEALNNTPQALNVVQLNIEAESDGEAREKALAAVTDAAAVCKLGKLNPSVTNIKGA